MSACPLVYVSYTRGGKLYTLDGGNQTRGALATSIRVIYLVCFTQLNSLIHSLLLSSPPTYLYTHILMSQTGTRRVTYKPDNARCCGEYPYLYRLTRAHQSQYKFYHTVFIAFNGRYVTQIIDSKYIYVYMYIN